MYAQPALVRFFGGLAEYAFESRLGVVDPPLIDYMVDLLVRFLRLETVHSVRNPTGRQLVEVAELLQEAEARQGEARREIHRHIGDVTLFWIGVYPEALRRLQGTSRLDRFIDYRRQGKRAYHIASTIPAQDKDLENQLLERLSHDYELCVQGLTEIRKEWSRRNEDGAGPTQSLIVE